MALKPSIDIRQLDSIAAYGVDVVQLSLDVAQELAAHVRLDLGPESWTDTEGRLKQVIKEIKSKGQMERDRVIKVLRDPLQQKMRSNIAFLKAMERLNRTSVALERKLDEFIIYGLSQRESVVPSDDPILARNTAELESKSLELREAQKRTSRYLNLVRILESSVLRESEAIRTVQSYLGDAADIQSIGFVSRSSLDIFEDLVKQIHAGVK